MGARGPRPKPTNLRILHGDKKSRINDDEPPAPEGAPELPDSVRGEVRQVWHFTVGVLKEMGLLSRADRDTLIAYCTAVVAHRAATEAFHDHGVLTHTASGSLMANPAMSAMNAAASQISKYAQHFGLTPSARSEIRMGNKPAPKDGPRADRYLTG